MVLQYKLPVSVSLPWSLASQTLASVELPQVQQARFRKSVTWGRPFEMLFLLLTIYHTGGKIVKRALAHGSDSLSET